MPFNFDTKLQNNSTIQNLPTIHIKKRCCAEQTTQQRNKQPLHTPIEGWAKYFYIRSGTSMPSNFIDLRITFATLAAKRIRIAQIALFSSRKIEWS